MCLTETVKDFSLTHKFSFVFQISCCSIFNDQVLLCRSLSCLPQVSLSIIQQIFSLVKRFLRFFLKKFRFSFFVQKQLKARSVFVQFAQRIIQNAKQCTKYCAHVNIYYNKGRKRNQLIYLRNLSIAPFSRRDTCACEMPISAAISIWVLPL